MLRNVLKQYIFYFLKLFLILTRQNDLKIKKKQIFSEIRFEPRSQTMRIRSSQHRITVAKNKYVLWIWLVLFHVWSEHKFCNSQSILFHIWLITQTFYHEHSFMMAIHLGSNGNPSKGIKYPRIEIVVASNRPTLPLANGDERSRIISWHEHYFN